MIVVTSREMLFFYDLLNSEQVWNFLIRIVWPIRLVTISQRVLAKFALPTQRLAHGWLDVVACALCSDHTVVGRSAYVTNAPLSRDSIVCFALHVCVMCILSGPHSFSYV